MHTHVHAHVMITVSHICTPYTGEGAFFTAATFVLLTVFIVAKTMDDLTLGTTGYGIHVHVLPCQLHYQMPYVHSFLMYLKP